MKPIPNFPGYFANKKGDIFTIKNPHNHKNKNKIRKLNHWLQFGYPRVGLYKNNKVKFRSIHTLVLETFVGRKKPGQITRHLNDTRTDNRLKNLAWGSSKENSEDAIKNGRILRGEKSPVSKLTCDEVDNIRKLLSLSRLSHQKIANKFGVSRPAITAISTGRNWKYHKSNYEK